MAWVGNWQNQFGSILRITSDAEGRIEGNFETAFEDSGFYGQTVPVLGLHKGNCIGFVAVGSSVTGDRVVSYTGLLRHGKIETAWFVVADQALSAAREGDPATLKPVNWWRAVTTNVDTFGPSKLLKKSAAFANEA
ncbi:hypothetical protein GWG65_29375 [Bradyrhizobium sp. CSA207]|uniref:avidin/streptavidin family protein n=1 Tax=Bradyrhizobium sp. CSA207 TaxID=2698826 RepID=UPI0023B0BBF9|nr:avidin/streptavidin family protein [Bradyrhizobium sp. CSA207]MDE5445468.1 hypothetical protein [Bradyrhizobium sp. CSA207]